MSEEVRMKVGRFLLSGGDEKVKAAPGRRTPYRLVVTDRGCVLRLVARGVLGTIAIVSCAAVVPARPQAAAAGATASQDSKDACAPVQAAYRKTTSTSNSSNATNTGALNVAEAYEKISTEAERKETCKYLRDETVAGEDANVYSDVFASKSGTANATVWISKRNGWVLKREVDVAMVNVGKGHQAIVFEYPK